MTRRALVFPIGVTLEGTFEIKELLHEDRDGQVFAAHDRLLGRDVVIKLRWRGLTAEPLIAEARALIALRRPGLAIVLCVGVQAGVEYVVYERLTGMTLAAHFEQRSHFGGFSLAESLEILIRIAETMSALDAADLDQGALAPSMVVLEPGARVVLFDPSVVHARPAAERERDLRAFGALAFEILTASQPRPDRSVSEQIAQLCTGVPEALARLVAQILGDATFTFEHVAATLRAIHLEPRTTHPPLSIVLADDDPDIRSLMRAILRSVAPTAILRFAADGHEALRLVQRDPPDVLFLDLQMPKLNGLEVCMYLRGTSVGDHVTICVMSQYAESHRAVLSGLGVTDVFVKGVQLAEAIDGVLRRVALRSAPPLASVTVEREVVGGRYELLDQLGEGGMGRVYRVRHLQLGKEFALKVIGPALVDDRATRERFLEEARLASEISHPNIVSVVDFGEDPTYGAYMVMELMRGTPLGETELSLRRACDVLAQVADALELVHRHGIIHGDLKAENIILVEEPAGTRRRSVARLLDFGLAQRANAAPAPELRGTPEYLAPERASGGPATVATEVYALGVLGYRLLAGALPFHGATEDVLLAQLRATPPSLTAQRGEPVDPALQTLISRAMAKDPAQRHPTVASFRYELNAVMDMLAFSKPRKIAS